MFSLLIDLTGGAFAPIPHLVDHWHGPAAKHRDSYSHIIANDAKDGAAFAKPLRGHEDGCVMGVCMESATALGNDGVLHAPTHKPVLRFL